MSRPFPRVALLALAVAIGTSLAPTAASAQIMVFRALKGKVVATSGNVIQWTDASNAEMYVRVVEQTKIKVTGEAEPSFLRPGLFVRFGASISKRGKIADEIEELTIFTPGNGFTTGLFEDGPVNPRDAESKYFVAGQIESFKNGLFTIETGEDSFKVKLSDDVKIKVEVPDISLAKADDEILITGGGEAKTQILATEIEITLAEPLAGEEKKARRPSKSRRSTRAKSDERQPVQDFDQDSAFVPDPDFE